MSSSVVLLLERLLHAFSTSDTTALRSVANTAISQSAMENDALKAELAVISYALEKLIGKPHFQKSKKWNFVLSSIAREFAVAVVAAKKQDMDSVKRSLLDVTKRISATDDEFGHYWEGLVEKSRVKQASTAYAFGLSLSAACALTSANKQELFSYIGYTKMHEETPVLGSIQERVGALESVLKGRGR
ncbi:MAG: hypothetical protein Q7R47_05320 [Candidatus Diapherotrites archaeon]|nr:hypothetical protein [Candidatus Diapherotrites archaeon]